MQKNARGLEKLTPRGLDPAWLRSSQEPCRHLQLFCRLRVQGPRQCLSTDFSFDQHLCLPLIMLAP